MQFKYGGVFLRKNAKHSFENALLVRCHFSRILQIGLMFVARFSWVPNLYNLHFLLENHRPQPDPVNSYRDIYTISQLWKIKLNGQGFHHKPLDYPRVTLGYVLKSLEILDPLAIPLVHSDLAFCRYSPSTIIL